MQRRFLFAVLFAAALVSGCSSTVRNPNTGEIPIAEVERRAYAEGVRQAMLDFKGKMQGQERFVYEPPIVECGVRVEGRVVNGAYIPSHETCVSVSPGRFVEQAPIYLPELGGGQ